jgi:hypothetical protein
MITQHLGFFLLYTQGEALLSLSEAVCKLKIV